MISLGVAVLIGLSSLGVGVFLGIAMGYSDVHYMVKTGKVIIRHKSYLCKLDKDLGE